MSTFDLAASHNWDHVWVVKWTDVWQGYRFSCERRFPQRSSAQVLVNEFAKRKRVYYSGAMAQLCPFRNVRLVQER